MTALTTALDTALQADAPVVFLAVSIALAGGTMYLLDGAGQATFGGNTYVSPDPTFGTLGPMQLEADGVDSAAPHITVSVLPPTNTAAATLAAASNQGAEVKIYMGAVTRTTGAVVADPYLLWDLSIDVPTLQVAMGSRTVSLDCASVFERMFQHDEGIGLTDASHESFWPGELGFEYVTDVTRQLPWGADAPRPGVITTASPGIQPGQIFIPTGPFFV